MNESLWQAIVKHGRLTQWILCGGGMLLCIVGGAMKFLSGDDIVKIVLALVAAGFGIEATINNHRKEY